MKIKPLASTWENLGPSRGRLHFRRPLSGRFYIHASIRNTGGAREGLAYAATLAFPHGPRVKSAENFRTLTAVMAWAMPLAQVECDRILADVPAAPKRRGMVKR